MPKLIFLLDTAPINNPDVGTAWLYLDASGKPVVRNSDGDNLELMGGGGSGTLDLTGYTLELPPLIADLVLQDASQVVPALGTLARIGRALTLGDGIALGGRYTGPVYQQYLPEGVIELVSRSNGGNVEATLQTSTGYCFVQWWDGTQAIVGSGDPEIDIVPSKAVPGSGSAFGRLAVKRVLLNSCDVNGGILGHFTKVESASVSNIGIMNLAQINGPYSSDAEDTGWVSDLSVVSSGPTVLPPKGKGVVHLEIQDAVNRSGLLPSVLDISEASLTAVILGGYFDAVIWPRNAQVLDSGNLGLNLTNLITPTVDLRNFVFGGASIQLSANASEENQPPHLLLRELLFPATAITDFLGINGYAGLEELDLSTFDGTTSASQTQLTVQSMFDLEEITLNPDPDNGGWEYMLLNTNPSLHVINNLSAMTKMAESPNAYGTLNIQDCNFSAEELDQLFTDLPPDANGSAVTVVGNPGAATCDPSIAEAKGYIVTTA